MRTRDTIAATLLVALLALAGVTAAIAADPAPPRIAFVANGHVPADALAAGPTAGQLGAPLYTTDKDALPEATRDALTAYEPELVIVLGGPAAIADSVVTTIADVTGLPTVDPTPPPATGVVRAAGADRFATAAAIADLLDAYNPAALPVDAKAIDADRLDGKDSTAFLGKTAKAADSDRLDGKDASAFADASHDHRVTVTRSHVCSGFDFQPFASTVSWTHVNHYWVPTGIAESAALCPLHLPDGAVIESVDFEFYDNHSSGRWTRLALWRGAPGTVDSVAFLNDPQGGDNAATPGFGSASLNLDETVDNSTHTYTVAMSFETTAAVLNALQAWHATVTYTMVDSPAGGE